MQTVFASLPLVAAFLWQPDERLPVLLAEMS